MRLNKNHSISASSSKRLEGGYPKAKDVNSRSEKVGDEVDDDDDDKWD